MLGAIIGDIVGSRFEFDNHRSKQFELFTPACFFTDDTVCTIAVADWILRSQGREMLPFAPILQSWCIRYPGSGYGGRFASWITNPVPYHSFGNGAGMRISPVGDASTDSEEVVRLARMATEVSHDHPEGIKGAQAIAMAVWMGKNGCTKQQIKAYIEDLGYDLGFTADSIRSSNNFDETCQVTVPQAIACFLESANFEDSMRTAISIGGDSDTIAAMTCSIAETFYEDIPSPMVQEAIVRIPEEMQSIVRSFYQMLRTEGPDGCRWPVPQIR